MAPDAQRYWDANASAYAFSHPIDFRWLGDVPKDARILDYGCGYGRSLAELRAAGWRNSVGVDFSREMIARGQREHPEVCLRHIEGTPIDEPDGAFDVALLFAVLTTIADDASQEALVSELARLLRPGGLIYVSDYPLQSDARYLERYRRGAAQHGVYGVWTREDGGVFRHHTHERLATLLSLFERVAERDIETRTLSGATAKATQLLARRR
jgi:SAM-dependent methyltransferase